MNDKIPYNFIIEKFPYVRQTSGKKSLKIPKG